MKLLVVVDMQNDFIDGALGTKEAQAIVPNVVNKIKNFEGFFIFTQDSHRTTTYADTLEGKLLPVPHCLVDENNKPTDGWCISKEIENVTKENLDKFYNRICEKIKSCKYVDELKHWKKYEKVNPYLVIPKDSFGSIFLPVRLKQWIEQWQKVEKKFEITEIEFCGLCTDICVVSNALILRAWFPNIPMKVDSSCCAGTTPENHEAALKVMKSCQIEVI